ncbi:MAG TPA: hypothetical protein VG077_06670, partial [Verrucomicrobiae bacterium]|nr:hypothetical protein [Verrucomicrobiae bacterium]
MEQRPEKPLKSENDNDILVLCVVAFGPQVSSGCIRSFIFHLFSQAAHKTCSTMKNIIKGVELEEVKNVILAMQANPLVGDIIPPAWHTNFPVCGDIRHGPKARAKRKGPPRRSVQHYLNMLLLAHILSWYRPILWKGDCGP